MSPVTGRRGVGRPVRAFGAGAAAAMVSGQAFRASLRGRTGGAAAWSRRNYAGRDVTLLAGPALVLGLAAGTGAGGSGRRLPLLVVGVGAVGFGDDRYGTRHARGLRGHLRELRAGRVTTGAVKLAGIGALSLALAPAATRRGRFVDGVLIATVANLVNLFDLRPGRALKVAALLLLPAVRPPVTGGALGALGAVAAIAPADLAERAMIGDCGANALGAAAGWLWAARGGGGRWLLLAAALGLTVASERVSFSDVIEAIPALRRFDRLGRRS